MKSIKKILSLVLAIACVITCFSVNTLTASALTQSGSYPKSTIGAYIISTNNKTAKAYSDQACTKSIGYIYSTDYCTIKAIYTNGVVQVGCPWSGYSGNRTVYTKLSYFFASTSVSVKTATVKTKCYYRTDLKSSPGSVYVGDKCYIVGTSGNYYQVLCPWSSGNAYRLVWVNKSAFGGHSHNYSTTGFEAVHPHKVYKKCSCGAYYYTGETKKYSSCTTCYPNTNKSNITLNVPYYAQNDSRWSSVYIGNKTIGSVGCLLTSLSMTYSYKTGTTVYPNAMKSKLRFSNNDFVWDSLSNIGFSRTSYNRNIDQAIYQSIYNHLKAGSPVIYGCGNNWHWVVITGYKGTSTSSFSASDFIINDPWANSTNKPTVGCRTTLQQYINNKGSYCQCIVYYK